MIIGRATKKKINFFYITTSFLIAGFVFLSIILTNVNFNARASATLPTITSIDPLASSLSGGTKMTINGSDIQPIYTQNLFIHNTQTEGQDWDIRFQLDTSRLIAQSKLRDNCGGLQIYDKDFNLIPVILEKGCNTEQTIFWLRANKLPTGLHKLTLAYNISAPDLPTSFTGLTNQIIDNPTLILRVSADKTRQSIEQNNPADTITNYATTTNRQLLIDGKTSLTTNPDNNLSGFRFDGESNFLTSQIDNLDPANTTMVSLWSGSPNAPTSQLWNISNNCTDNCQEQYKYNTYISGDKLRIDSNTSIQNQPTTTSSNYKQTATEAFLLTQLYNQNQNLLYLNNAISDPLAITTSTIPATTFNLQIGPQNPQVYLHEFLVFEKKMTTFEIQQIRNYLAQTYGLSQVFGFPIASLEGEETVSSLIAIDNNKQWANYISDQQIQFFSPDLDIKDYTSVDLKVYNYDILEGEVFFSVKDFFAYTKTTTALPPQDIDQSFISNIYCQHQETELKCQLDTLAKTPKVATLQVLSKGQITASCDINLESLLNSCAIPNLTLTPDSIAQLKIDEKLFFQNISIAPTAINPTPTTPESANQNTISTTSNPAPTTLDISEQPISQTNPPASTDNLIANVECKIDKSKPSQNFNCDLQISPTSTSEDPINLYFFINDELVSSSQYSPDNKPNRFIWDGLSIEGKKVSKLSFNTVNSAQGATSLDFNQVSSTPSLMERNEPLFALSTVPEVAIFPNAPATSTNDDGWKINTIIIMGSSVLAAIVITGYFTLKTTNKKYTPIPVNNYTNNQFNPYYNYSYQPHPNHLTRRRYTPNKNKKHPFHK